MFYFNKIAAYILLSIILSILFSDFSNGSTLLEISSDNEPESSIERVPYTASILRHGKKWCGAAILTEYWLITSGVKTYGDLHRINPEWLTVVTGTNDINLGGNRHIIEEIIHPHDFAYNSYNDLALVRLKYPIQFDEKQQKIEIAHYSHNFKENSVVEVSGFGHTETSRPEIRVSKMMVENLNISSGRRFRVSNVGRTDCVTDPGDPAVFNEKLVGISYRRDVCHPGMPYDFMKISYYYDWIMESIPELMFEEKTNLFSTWAWIFATLEKTLS